MCGTVDKPGKVEAEGVAQDAHVPGDPEALAEEVHGHPGGQQKAAERHQQQVQSTTTYRQSRYI